jgi:SOS-response transcriptional repressor LexA
MDEKWFKRQQKIAGVTAEDIANAMGRARSNVSHILNGHQKMSLEWAKAFSEVLKVPLDEVLRRAGVMDEPTVRALQPGFSESDAAPFVAKPGDNRQVQMAADVFGARPGVDVWQVKSQALSYMGYMPGDYMLVDTHAAERVRAGDVVVAQVYDNAKGTASTALRRYEPPVLVAASPDPEDRRVHVVDGVNVVIRGRVVASWRS